MELPHIGAQCSKPDCKQLDFLPFPCDECGRVFCKDHYLSKDHVCDHSLVVEKTDNIATNCPICDKLVVAHEGKDINQLMSAHIESGCQANVHESSIQSFKCSMSSCNTRELIKVLCSDCNNNFCIAHRSPAAHKCPKAEQNNENNNFKRQQSELRNERNKVRLVRVFFFKKKSNL